MSRNKPSHLLCEVGAGVADDPQVRALEEATRPEALVRQIEEAFAERRNGS